MNNIPQLPRYVGNTLDTINFRLEDGQEKLNHIVMYKSRSLPSTPKGPADPGEMLCGPLNHIFNKSAETGIIPED